MIVISFIVLCLFYSCCSFDVDANAVPPSINTDIVPINHTQRYPSENKSIKYYDPDQCGKVNYSIYNEDVSGMRKKRIVGGKEPVRGEHPWQTSIRYIGAEKTSTGHSCGGVIITKYHILTVAHCFDESKKYIVRVGDHNHWNIEDSQRDLEVDHIYLHENYNQSDKYDNDIAIVKLKPPTIEFNTYVKNICLPPPELKFTPGLNCTITGWTSDRTFHYAVIPSLPIDTCKSGKYHGPESPKITDGVFCAGYLNGPKIDTCEGDSGSPMICNIDGKNILYGLTSWGQSCDSSNENKPGLYTNVLYYRDWIEKIINNDHY